jgi:hypothetical protein
MNTSFNSLLSNIRNDDRFASAANIAEEKMGDYNRSFDGEGEVAGCAQEDNAQELIDSARLDAVQEIAAAFEDEMRQDDEFEGNEDEFNEMLDRVTEAANAQLEDLCDRIVASQNVPE